MQRFSRPYVCAEPGGRNIIQEPHGQLLVERIIRHEQPLLPDDDVAIKVSLSHLKNAKNTGETRIAALEAELWRLKEQQEAVCTSLQKHESVFSPIHRLPNEILLHIFQLCLPKFYRDSCLDWNDVRFRLARTCRWWSDIVEGSPKLWATLVMRFEDSYRDDESDSLSEFLRLSGEQPLKIVVIDNTHLLDIAATLKLLVPHSYRWQHLVLSNATSARCLFEDLMPESIPMLEELYISKQWLAPWTSSEAMAAVSSAPSLKKAQLPFGLSFPPNLTHAHLRLACNDGESAVKNFFTSHPFLTECHIFLAETHSPEIWAQSDYVEHTNLQTLVTDHTIFLDRLKLPILSTLHLSATDVPIEPSSVDSVVRFVKRSQCQLTTLSVAQQSLYDSPEFITELLPLVSESVTRLYLNTEESLIPNDEISRAIMGALKHNHTAAGLFPRLTSLSLRTCVQNIDDFLEPFFEMVCSRWSSELATQCKAARLADLGVDVREAGTFLEKGLLELADEGLSIWSVKHTRYGSRITEYPPWLEYEPLTRNDLSKRRLSTDSYANESSCSDIEAMQYTNCYLSDSDSESVHSTDSYSFSPASNISWAPAPLAPPFLPSTQILPHLNGFVPYGAPPFIPPGPLLHPNADQHFHHWFPIGVPPSNNAPSTSSPQNVMHVYHHFSPSGDVAADAFSSPLQAPVIPDFSDDDDDDYDGPEMTFPPVFNPDTMGPMFQSPSQFPYPFNPPLQNPSPSQIPYPFNMPSQEPVPLSPSQFPYPFNMPMHHPFDLDDPPPPHGRSSSRHARFSREVSRFGSPSSSPRTDGGSILLQAEGPSSLQHSPDATSHFDDDLSDRPLSPLEMAGFEDVECDDNYPRASGSGLDSGYGGSPPFSSRQGSSSTNVD